MEMKCDLAVVVAVNDERLFNHNILASPGLKEIGAQIIAVRGATSAADAYEKGAAQTTASWILYCHQDVYFPEGSGYEIENLLKNKVDVDSAKVVLGFAGLSGKLNSENTSGAGLVMDRGRRLDWPATKKAVSIDELAVIMHRDCKYKIDAKLGWHLWATDLSLQAAFGKSYAEIIRVLVHHNSPHDCSLPAEFYCSRKALKDKYPRLSVIHTLCTTIRRVLIAISSCEAYEQSSLNQPLRDTWLPEAVALGFDYKFFHGRGATPKDDTVVVNVDDGYDGLCEKYKEKIKWALRNNYSHIFTCLAEVYACPSRLLSSGFEQYDYFGGFCCTAPYGKYCQGGAGYFLNRKSCERLIADKDTPCVPTKASDDTWTGHVLRKAGILPVFTPNIVGFPTSRYNPSNIQYGPRVNNTITTVHLSYMQSDLVYRPEDMYSMHSAWVNKVPMPVKATPLSRRPLRGRYIPC